MTIKERIEIFIERQGIKRSVFERLCGLSNSYTRNLKVSPSMDKIEDILNAYPELNRVWLLSGEGEMLKESAMNVGEISGSGNTVGMTVTQTIGENNGQNAGRDIHNPPCHYSEKLIMAEIESQRKLTEKQFEFYAASLEKKDNQIRTAQSQIDALIKQNKEQFDRLVSLLANK